MKSRYTAPALIAFATLSSSMLIADHVSAHQTVSNSYSYPKGTGTGYLKARATCNTHAPDFDSDCTNGDSLGMQWFVRTKTTGEVDLEYSSATSMNITQGGHFWCNETLSCSDGTGQSYTYLDTPCGWAACPNGKFATKIQVSFGIDNNPS